MLQIRFRLLDHVRDALYSLAQIRNAFLRGIEIARDQKIETVGETLIVNERVPLRLAQFLKRKNLVIDVVAQNPNVDLVGAGQLLEIVEFIERLADLLRVGEHSRPT